MNAYQVIPFDRAHIGLLPRGQEPFDVIGQLAVRYDGAAWQTGEILLEEPRQKTYPNDLFDPEEYLNDPNSAAVFFTELRKLYGSWV